MPSEPPLSLYPVAEGSGRPAQKSDNLVGLRSPRGHQFQGSLQFTPNHRGTSQCINRYISTRRQSAHSRVLKRNPWSSCAMQRHRNFWLAKVGVEGSNPFARSKFPKKIKLLWAATCPWGWPGRFASPPYRHQAT